jgi:hypothetical protein
LSIPAAGHMPLQRTQNQASDKDWPQPRQSTIKEFATRQSETRQSQPQAATHAMLMPARCTCTCHEHTCIRAMIMPHETRKHSLGILRTKTMSILGPHSCIQCTTDLLLMHTHMGVNSDNQVGVSLGWLSPHCNTSGPMCHISWPPHTYIGSIGTTDSDG